MVEEFLRLLVANFSEADTAAEIPQPARPLKKRDIPIGKLSPGMQKWYAVYSASRDEFEVRCEMAHHRMVEILDRLPEKPTRQEWEFIQEESMAYQMYKFVESVFWLGVMGQFPKLAVLKQNSNIVVCQGWIVALTLEEPQKPEWILGEIARIIGCDLI